MTKHTKTLHNFHNNLGAISGLIGETELLHIIRVMEGHEELLTAIKTAVEIIKDSYGEGDVDVESDCQAVNVLIRALKK